jgi:hypothetical protein
MNEVEYLETATEDRCYDVLPELGMAGILMKRVKISQGNCMARTFFEKFLINDELTNLAFQAGGLRFALFDALAGSVLPLEEFSDALLQLLFSGTDLRWGDILIDGDLFFLEGFKCHTGFEFGG